MVEVLSPSLCFSLQMDLDERNLVNTDNNTLFYLFLTWYNDSMLLPLVSRRLVQSQVRLKAIYPWLTSPYSMKSQQVSYIKHVCYLFTYQPVFIWIFSFYGIATFHPSSPLNPKGMKNLGGKATSSLRQHNQSLERRVSKDIKYHYV